MTPSAWLLLAIAPLVYWTLGAPFLLHRGASGLRMALLTGGAVAGLSCEVTFATGLPARILLVPILIASIALMIARRKKWQWADLGEAYLLYGVALVPAVFSPFPVIGLWGGDWFLLLSSGRTLWDGGQLSFVLLERPPLFGAATAPLWLVSDGLIPYQIFCAVMSAGTLGACLFAADRLWPGISRGRLLAPLVLSVFFLHHTATCWGKLTAAAFLLAAAIDLLGGYSKTRTWWAGIWFALAVAIHQSSVIYIPLLIAIAVTQPQFNSRSALKTLGIFATCSFIFVGFYESWTIWKYGLGLKIGANPSVSLREPEVSFMTNTFLVIVNSFLGWAPLDYLAWWLRTAHLSPEAHASKAFIALGRLQAFWLATSWLQIQAGTFVGAFLPFLIAGRLELLRRFRVRLLEKKRRLLIGAGLLVILLNGVLNPYASRSGTMQTGLVGLGLAGFLFSGAWLASVHPHRWRLAITIIVAIGTLPWVALNLALTAGVELKEGFNSSFFAKSDNDWQLLVSNHLSSLGLSGFPLLHLTLTVLMGTWFCLAKRLARKAQ